MNFLTQTLTLNFLISQLPDDESVGNSIEPMCCSATDSAPKDFLQLLETSAKHAVQRMLSNHNYHKHQTENQPY